MTQELKEVDLKKVDDLVSVYNGLLQDLQDVLPIDNLAIQLCLSRLMESRYWITQFHHDVEQIKLGKVKKVD